MKKIKETGLLEKARERIKKRKMLFADQDAIFWSTTKKLLLPRIYNEQSKFDKKKYNNICWSITTYWIYSRFYLDKININLRL